MTENALPTKRNQTIDAAKGMGMFLVVFAHMNYMEPWQSIIYGFHIPLFFILAGMTFQQDKYSCFWGFVKRRIHTLLLPYLFFALFAVLYRTILDIAFEGISAAAFVNAGKYLLQFITATYSQNMVANVALWFVPCLFLVECIYYLIVRIPSLAIRLCIIIMLVGVGWFTESSLCPVDFSVLPWNFSSACFSVGFYAFGHLSANKLGTLIFQSGTAHKKVRTLVLAVLCFAVAVLVAKYNGVVSIGSRKLGNGFLFYLSGIMGSVGVLCLGEILKHVSLITFWGKTSFCIMSTHLLVHRLFLRIYDSFFPGDYRTTYFSWRMSLLFFVAVMIISSILAWVYTYARQVIRKKSE